MADPVQASSSPSGPPGRPGDNVSRALGLFSAALGVPQVVAPGRVARLIGLKDDGRTRFWMRAVGVRELAAATGILTRRRPTGWVWSRVAGDTMDLALLRAGLGRKAVRPTRTVIATGAVLGVTAADAAESVRLTRREAVQTPSASTASQDGKAAGPMHARAAITVRRPRKEVYAFWHDFENMPQFMAHVESVQITGIRRSHWVATAPAGRRVEWDAEMTADEEAKLIAWRSLEGADVENSGTVRFLKAPGDQGTEIQLELHYAMPGGALGAAVAKLFGEEPSQQVRDDLRRFKQVMETGEVVLSDGSPEGTLAIRLARQRPAHPLESEPIGTKGGPS
ncbi:MAG: cyclase [Solirubrobacterales bacterium]|nr:cyclase [Solirubrobacterales bacterium]